MSLVVAFGVDLGVEVRVPLSTYPRRSSCVSLGLFVILALVRGIYITAGLRSPETLESRARVQCRSEYFLTCGVL